MNHTHQQNLERRYDLIVWDWDGTVMDSTPTIVHCIQQACRDLDLPVPNDALASSVIGLGIDDSLRRAVPSIAPARYPALVARFRFHYLARDHELHLFIGIRELLEHLRQAGFLLAVATGKSRQGLDRSLGFHQLEALFHASRTADETASKPNPTMLLELSDVLQVPLRRMLMIGDTTHDLLMAQNAGVDSVGVTYGAHPLEELRTANALICVDNVQELAQWFNQHLYEQTLNINKKVKH
ncbi:MULTISPECIES: HAD-IA family hydrolase [unclassified Polynucleobacter]|uniref:HAD-IA family hydrolase n=1 Tax=unclassified Polynucleobacter TaxID=2640945 RepID=UPI002102319A|nr:MULTISPECIES: HAD-IA family hydrolase [unclassified Polynucleobacter]